MYRASSTLNLLEIFTQVCALGMPNFLKLWMEVRRGMFLKRFFVKTFFIFWE